ncbi:kynureninase [Halorussus gelatinilyticus]|uniref:Kynureninase n=1 Tax=Halorussus gelatinilyticus TaxID=2937524 RepID=A0A8U0IKJ6_9EURY|nr:kynureninase [Halorussus gelatinilyticus]UPW01623.1 kynureninase [Halorussus gelatinilyticus]
MNADDFELGADYAAERDAGDPLAHLADRFYDPDDEWYFDGNSLGLCSADAEAALDRAVAEWKDLAIRGWTDADPPWFYYGERLGDRLAPLVGADESEVVVANSTTVNIHTLVGTFYDRAEGTKIVVDELDFPTDHYAVRAQLRQRGVDPDEALTVVESRDGRTVETEDIIDALDDDTAMVFLPSVLYRSGQLLDVAAITEAAHERGILAGFDLAHSVGVVPHDLSRHGVDFAVWCSYKYLNSGPGAIAGLYVNEDHFDARPALAGWWGHDKETQFEMNPTYTPADDAGAYQIGTIPILSAAPLAGSLEIFEDAGETGLAAATDVADATPTDAADAVAAGIEAVRVKSVALTEYLVFLVDERLPDCEVGTPRDPERRGGHVAIEHPEAYRVGEALKERGVVVDFRPPNVVRVCPSPLYTSFEDVWEVVEQLKRVVENEEYEEFETRGGGVA